MDYRRACHAALLVLSRGYSGVLLYVERLTVVVLYAWPSVAAVRMLLHDDGKRRRPSERRWGYDVLSHGNSVVSESSPMITLKT